jgi:hypothetical protein
MWRDGRKLTEDSTANVAERTAEPNGLEQAHDPAGAWGAKTANEISSDVDDRHPPSYRLAWKGARSDAAHNNSTFSTLSSPPKSAAFEIERNLVQTQCRDSKRTIELAAFVLLIIHYKGFLLNKIHST